ncbi:MAG: DoxX family protein [Litorimonas sp.]
MKKLTLALTVIVAALFVFFGVQKFGATNIIFSTIADRSGISLFEPVIRIFTGVAEIATAILILVPRTRLLGAAGGVALVGGAIGFHLSPWLGINVPGIGHGLFITALVLFLLSAVLAVLLRKQGHTLFSGQKNV